MRTQAAAVPGSSNRTKVCFPCPHCGIERDTRDERCPNCSEGKYRPVVPTRDPRLAHGKKPTAAISGCHVAEADAAAIEGDTVNLRECQQDPDLGRVYVHKGKIYREKVVAGVNSNHSIEDIFAYAIKWPPRHCARRTDVAWEVPYESIDDFVNAMRQSSKDSTGAFLWPSEHIGIMRAMGVSLHHLPVEHMTSIKNAQKTPKKSHDESEEAYLSRAASANTPVIDTAVAWKNSASKTVQKFLQKLAAA